LSVQLRGLVLLILDTLRADYDVLCREYGISLSQLPRLHSLCSAAVPGRCGSFPTGPMRTDLLTGRLAFLSGDWALPQTGEETIVGLCRQKGFWTTLVTDNYVATVPRLGGMLLDEFDTIDFVRGAGSDPWITPSIDLLSAAQEMAQVRPTRSSIFEAQFVANCRRWPKGRPPFERVFEAACEHLHQLVRHERFLLWVDTFACHEPWISSADLETGILIPEEPLFPGYVEKGLYSQQHLEALRARFARRIGETDRAMGPFVGELESAMRSGDVGVVVLSDHGFLFGEFGFIGKPANTPLPPELHEIVCWLSVHFAKKSLPSVGMQPHLLHWLLREALGIGGAPMEDPAIHLFARNSPRSNYLAAADQDDLYVLEKAQARDGAQLRTIRRSDADRSEPLARQGDSAMSNSVRSSICTILNRGSSPWLLPFRELLSVV